MTTTSATPMSADPKRRGLLDTNVLIHRGGIDATQLPDELAISAVTLGELSAGPLLVRSDDAQDEYEEHAERARRLAVLQRAESEFEPIPFGASAARAFGQLTAHVVATGRQPRRRTTDLMIAATAIAEGLPLYTTDPSDFAGLEAVLSVVAVSRPDRSP